jgi:DNA-binding transcriptional regulator YbjK
LPKSSAGQNSARRDAIVAAALEIITDEGVHRTTHRRIAERARVPLGSLTYYFDNLTEIIEAAFGLLAATMETTYHDALAKASTRDDAIDAVVDLICGGDYATQREVTGLLEMYAYGNHNETVNTLGRTWLGRSRQNLSLHFSEPTSRALDALIEGWPLHQAWEGSPADRAIVHATVSAIVERLEPRV